MIPATVAHTISQKHEVNIMKDAIDRQRKEISKAIEDATLNGLYTVFLSHELYEEIEQELRDNGYELIEIYEGKAAYDHRTYNVFKGINIRW